MRWVSLITLLLCGASLVGCGAPEPPDRLVYLAIGASDAAAVGAEPMTDGYVYRIADALDERIHELLNDRARLARQVGISKHTDGHTVDFYRPEREADLR